MKLNSPELLEPVFDFLDGLIRDHGDILFMVFAYAAIPFVVWVLCGGLRRRSRRGKPKAQVPPVIVLYVPVGRTTPPPEPFDPFLRHRDPPWRDSEDYHLN